MNMFAGKQLNDLYTHAIHIHNSQLASSLSSSRPTVCSVVLECPATPLSKHNLSSNRRILNRSLFEVRHFVALRGKHVE